MERPRFVFDVREADTDGAILEPSAQSNPRPTDHAIGGRPGATRIPWENIANKSLLREWGVWTA